MPRASTIAREREPDTYVPFVGHAAPNVILLDDGALLAMLALDGVTWETADVDDVILNTLGGLIGFGLRQGFGSLGRTYRHQKA